MVVDVNIVDVDLERNPEHTWEITNSDGQPDSETITFFNRDTFTRTFTYKSLSGFRVMIKRSKWVKG